MTYVRQCFDSFMRFYDTKKGPASAVPFVVKRFYDRSRPTIIQHKSRHSRRDCAYNARARSQGSLLAPLGYNTLQNCTNPRKGIAMAQNSVLDRIKKLDEEKAQLLSQAKSEALAKANTAIDELNSLGFNYRLIEAKAGSIITGSPAGTRRSGIRQDVLDAVTNAGPDGITPAKIRESIGVDGKSGAQSVSNALSALKKAGKITDKNGAYVAA